MPPAQVANPYLEVRSSGTVHNAALYSSAGPDLQIRIRHWIGTHYVGRCTRCIRYLVWTICRSEESPVALEGMQK